MTHPKCSLDVRHSATVSPVQFSESLWNHTFNRGINFKLPFRVAVILLWETILVFIQDSVLFDSPLSTKGLSECVALARWIRDVGNGATECDVQSKNVVDILRGTSKNQATITTSNLRRSISTVLIASSQKLKSSVLERIFVLSCLQEVTRNPDGMSLSLRGGVPPVSQLECRRKWHFLEMPHLYATNLEMLYNKGTKGLLSTLHQRLLDFSAWAFDTCLTDHIVVCGHSIWFKSFCKLYMPAYVDHIAKTKKISNCSIVKFELTKLVCDGDVDYWVDPDSFSLVYGSHV